MARPRSRKPAPPSAFVASAVQMDSRTFTSSRPQKAKGAQAWQGEAWRYYDLIGEYRYACDWVGSMLSRAALRVKRGGQVVTEGPAHEAMVELYGGMDAHPQMLRLLGVHLTVAGDWNLISYTEGDKQKWQVISPDELTSPGQGRWSLSNQPLPDQTLVIYGWRPHPRIHTEPNSPTKAILPVLAEILGFTQHVQAQINSRLAGAGIFLFPSEATLPAIPTEGEEAEGVVHVDTADQLMTILTKAMASAITNRESAEAVVPIVITAPGEVIDKARHITFWSELDEQTKDLRLDAIRRLALGLDMPPEVLTGLAELNHWSAWSADESAIKAHTEPLLGIITSSLTEGYLRPALTNEDGSPIEGLEGDPAEYYISADTSQMRLRPNRSKEALELYDRGELDGQALRRETGFGDDDAPDEDEQKLWLLRKIAQGSATPEQVHAALEALGVTLDLDHPGDQPREARPAPSLIDHPERELPDSGPFTVRADLLAASEQMVHRALERAGNRLRTKTGGRIQGVAAADHYRFAPMDPSKLSDLLEDAWTHLPRFAQRYDADPDRLTDALDAYCRTLLAEKREHSVEMLAEYLELAVK